MEHVYNLRNTNEHINFDVKIQFLTRPMHVWNYQFHERRSRKVWESLSTDAVGVFCWMIIDQALGIEFLDFFVNF